ncbi:MAG: hypothetical protein IPM17_09115 [Verrucomicrobia bacterium]|nr:hypothetical protein [Verrucomicrobiota bacterium]
MICIIEERRPIRPGHHSPFTIRHSLRLGEPFGNQLVQRHREQEVHERRARVVRAQVFALRAQGCQVNRARGNDEALGLGRRVRQPQRVAQQRFIHRAEFLDAEFGVVDPLLEVFHAHMGQLLDGLQQKFVLTRLRHQVRRALEVEQLAVERKHADVRCALGEHLERDLQPFPQVAPVRLNGLALGQPRQGRDRVGLGVEALGGKHPALLGKQEEQDAVDDQQQLVVEGAGGLGVIEHLPELRTEQTFRQGFDGPAHLRLKLAANLDALGLARLEQGFERDFGAVGGQLEPAAMAKPEQRPERREVAGFKNGVQVEAYKSLGEDVVEITQQPELPTVGHNAPGRRAVVQVVLEFLVR